MNYIQTLFIDSTKDFLKDTFGWISPRFHIMSWTLSCLSLKDSLGKIELYANKKGIDLLVNLLGLPYDKVHEFPSEWEMPYSDLWALPKIYTYSLQEEPFIHIDGDIFIFKKFPESLTKAPVVAQNLELFTDYYYNAMPLIKEKFKYIPQYVINDFSTMNNLKAINAGILGGNDLDFFKKYTEEVFRYINFNLECLPAIDINRFNVFFEQHLCFNMSKVFNRKIEYLLEPMYCDNEYNDLAEFHKIPSRECSYIHLLGDYKRDLFTCTQMEKTLMCLYPQYYEKVLKIIQNTSKTVSDKNNIQNGITRLGNKTTFFNSMKKLTCNSYQENDLDSWISNIQNAINTYSDISDIFLKQRDKDSFTWYTKICNKEKKECRIKRALGIKIFHSKYDWARLFRGLESKGNIYYNISSQQLTLGDYYSIFIKEESEYSFSIFDLDELEYTIVKELETAITLEDLYKRMYDYVDYNTLQHYAEKYQILLKQNIERLIKIKAIMPEI